MVTSILGEEWLHPQYTENTSTHRQILSFLLSHTPTHANKISEVLLTKLGGK